MLQTTGLDTTLNAQVSQYKNDLNQTGQSHYANVRQNGTIMTSEQFSLKTDTVSLSYSSESVVSYDSTMTLQGGYSDVSDLLKSYVMSIFEEQGMSLNLETGDSTVNLEEISQQEAAALVAEDGYFGVEQTSDRIVDFAIGIAGGDHARLDAIKAGVEQGFNEALEAFGGALPEISYTTYDAVMEKLDAWAEESR